MGFGFNFLVLFLLIPLTIVLSLSWIVFRKADIGKVLGLLWLGVFGMVLISTVGGWLTAKTKLDKTDYYGQYVINRDYFKGEQCDWQYNHFRFEIAENDSIYFHVTEGQKILETYKGRISTTTQYSSARLIISMENPTHHIMKSNPTTYRSAWSFYLVFDSERFDNVFFKKGKWKPIKS